MPSMSQKPNSLYDISNGIVPGTAPAHLMGINDTVGTTNEDLWNQGGIMDYPSSAETVNVVSTSVNDASAGTGARSIRIVGLDNDFEQITEDVTMNGTTNVLTTNSYIRINSFFVLSAGSGVVNAGDITATNSSSAQVMCNMNATDNIAMQVQFTIPARKKGNFLRGFVSCLKGDDATFELWQRPNGGVFYMVTQGHIFESFVDLEFMGGNTFPAKTDITIRARASAGSADASGGFDLILVDV